MSDPQTVRSHILLSGLGDWVSLAEAASLMRRTEPEADPREIKKATLAVLRELLTSHLIQGGELKPRFVPRQDSPDEVIDAVDRDWTGPDTELRPWDGWWFANTEAGNAVAETLTATS